jgi:hypothetical protein
MINDQLSISNNQTIINIQLINKCAGFCKTLFDFYLFQMGFMFLFGHSNLDIGHYHLIPC